MTDNIPCLLLNSLLIAGLYTACYYELGEDQRYNAEASMIFGQVKMNMERFLPDWLFRPLIGCMVCMASVWGTLFYFYTHDHFELIDYVCYIFALAGLNKIVYRLVG